ncbi:MAG: methyltransferase domain-containing protein [Clostridia bacterium]|nr:methyltransferase domain-containing protein [Clostridia bacterium]
MYKGFAAAYDALMHNTPYDDWFEHLMAIYKKENFKGKDILDLACGTGEMSMRLSKKGFKVLGVDLSQEMLEIAQEKAYEKHLKIHYIQQDMTELELFHQYDSVISYCDGFNYITDENDLKAVFKTVFQYLKPGGLFVFDMSSFYKLSIILGENVIAENNDDISFIWENYFDPETNLLEFDLTIFQREKQFYRKFEETHVQRAYPLEQIESFLKRVGFEMLEILDTDTRQAVDATSERWLFVGRKPNE